MTDADSSGKVTSWLEKGDGDLRAARLLLEAEPPMPSPSCFHSQQAAEKYLKGFLVHLGVEPPRTHDLILLLDLVAEKNSSLEDLRETAEPLGPLAVQVRYPFQEATEAEARDALKRAETICSSVREQLLD